MKGSNVSPDQRDPWKLRTGAPWRDLPDRCGPWKTAHERRLRTWTADDTWEHSPDHVVVKDDSVGAVEWSNSVDSRNVRARRDWPSRDPSAEDRRRHDARVDPPGQLDGPSRATWSPPNSARSSLFPVQHHPRPVPTRALPECHRPPTRLPGDHQPAPRPSRTRLPMADRISRERAGDRRSANRARVGQSSRSSRGSSLRCSPAVGSDRLSPSGDPQQGDEDERDHDVVVEGRARVVWAPIVGDNDLLDMASGITE